VTDISNGWRSRPVMVPLIFGSARSTAGRVTGATTRPRPTEPNAGTNRHVVSHRNSHYEGLFVGDALKEHLPPHFRLG
jgi:hypothetical protein